MKNNTSSSNNSGLLKAFNWQAFLAKHDLIWEVIPRQWNEGAFTGNGQLGLMAYATLDDNRFDFHLGRADITDHRLAPDRATSLGTPGAGVRYHHPRLNLGRMALRPAGKIQSANFRLNLWNAELRGTLKTDLGEIHLRVLTLRDRMVHLLEVESSERNPDSTPAAVRWEFLPGNPSTPRIQVLRSAEQEVLHPRLKELHRSYEKNPPPQIKMIGEVAVCEQRLLAGGDYSTAWLQVNQDGNRQQLFISTMTGVPKNGLSAAEAVAEVNNAAGTSVRDLIAEHLAWWNAYYPRGFIMVPDLRIESFYWIQLYKMASAVREKGPALDLAGPWFRINVWPGMWWNLNLQLTYWPFPMSNRMELSQTLIDYLDKYFVGVLENGWLIGAGDTLGDMTWVLHNYWLHYRYLGDWSSLAEKWLPLADRVLERYRSKLEPGEDGCLHLQPMGSPEYGEFSQYRDTNYNLALLRWLLATMVEVKCQTDPADQEASTLRELAKNLTKPPVDETGLMIGAGQALELSHRHFSHLIGFYPLFVFNPDNPDELRLLKKSIDHWIQIENPDGSKDHCVFTLAIAASQYAAIGDGTQALAFLQAIINNDLIKNSTCFASRILPNTFSAENNGRDPTMESPMATASATMELLLQSWGNRVRIFPAVPKEWKSATFHRLRAQGGFIVSAVRCDFRTRWVAIESAAGEPLTIKVADWNGPLMTKGPRNFTIQELGSGEYAIDLRRGEQVFLAVDSSALQELEIKPVGQANATANPYGLRPGMELKTDASVAEIIPHY